MQLLKQLLFFSGKSQRYANLVSTLLQPKASDDVLHVGCGNGKYLRTIHQKVKTVAGLDRSTARIRKACFRCRQLNDHAGVRLRAGSVRHMPWADHSYSLIFSDAVLETSINPEEHLLECLRLLRPGGKLLVRVKHHVVHPPKPYELRSLGRAFHHYTLESLRNRLESSGFHCLPLPEISETQQSSDLWMLARKPLGVVQPQEEMLMRAIPVLRQHSSLIEANGRVTDNS